MAFVPKPLPPGYFETFQPWAWTGVRLSELGRYIPALDGWLARRFEAMDAAVVHPEVGVVPTTFVSMHADVRMAVEAISGDFDGDGSDEFVLVSGEARDDAFVFVSVFRGPLDGLVSEQDAWVRLHLPPGAQEVRDLEAMDLDGDGREELIVAYAMQGPEVRDRVAIVTADDLLARVPPSD